MNPMINSVGIDLHSPADRLSLKYEDVYFAYVCSHAPHESRTYLVKTGTHLAMPFIVGDVRTFFEQVCPVAVRIVIAWSSEIISPQLRPLHRKFRFHQNARDLPLSSDPMCMSDPWTFAP